jgi:hypothetical protein
VCFNCITLMMEVPCFVLIRNTSANEASAILVIVALVGSTSFHV